VNHIARSLLIASGTLCVCLAVLGIFLPILPTTPFLLLAAYLYARSSERFLHWLLTNQLFGAYIDHYRQGLGMPRREKILTVIALWLTIGFSALHVVQAMWLRVLLGAIAAGVTVHLARIPTYVGSPRLQPPKTHAGLELDV
jgi:uncharacterized membrane protein YbaN (DUF454 family)